MNKAMNQPSEVDELDEILDTLETRIKSSHRDTFMETKLPAENGESARLARESAKNVAKEKIQALIASKVLEARENELDLAKRENVITGGMHARSYYAIDPYYYINRRAELQAQREEKK